MVCETIKSDTCVLMPREYAKLREVMDEDHRILCDALLHTGMRGTEFAKFIQNTEWYKPSRRCIDLPKLAITKKATLYKQRTVILSVKGCASIERIIEAKLKSLPKRQSFNEYLDSAAIRCGLGKDHICPKMFRKTIISWLVACFPEKQMYINHSAGHTRDVQLNDYLGVQFRKEDVEDMRVFLKGWGET